jgi:ABC-type branched-subunit amino acid transport system substrate-binding protein
MEHLFRKALDQYRNKSYRSAIGEFERILDLPLNERYSIALLMIGKSHYELHAYDEAIQSVERLLREFPTSTYGDDAHYLLGRCYARQGEYVRAAEEYLTIIEMGVDPRLVERAQSRLSQLISHNLNSGEIGRLQRRHPDSSLLTEATAPVLSRFTVGVIAPLTGDFEDVGHEMVQAIRLALRYSDLTNVDVIIEDSQGDPIQAVKAAQKLTRDETVAAIIGPVRSETTIGAAAVANCENVVLITPTATETGIADIGPYIFQLNVTPQIQGSAVAEYAIEHLGLNRFAVLTVSDSYGKDLTASFVSKVAELGGTVLSQEWYYEGATDFSSQLTHIREAGLLLEQADSLTWEWKLFALKTSGLIDTTAGQLFPPVDSIDGLFLAAYGDDIPLIASQVAFQKINTQLLGGNSWNSEVVLREGEPYVEGAVFAADFFEQNLSDRYLQFINRYRQRYGQTPTKVAALSYDAALLLLDIFTRGVRSNSEIRDRLADTRHFQGASGFITFPPDGRANTHVLFLTIRNGEIVELQ